MPEIGHSSRAGLGRGVLALWLATAWLWVAPCALARDGDLVPTKFTVDVDAIYIAGHRYLLATVYGDRIHNRTRTTALTEFPPSLLTRFGRSLVSAASRWIYQRYHIAFPDIPMSFFDNLRQKNPLDRQGTVLVALIDESRPDPLLATAKFVYPTQQNPELPEEVTFSYHHPRLPITEDDPPVLEHFGPGSQQQAEATTAESAADANDPSRGMPLGNRTGTSHAVREETRVPMSDEMPLRLDSQATPPKIPRGLHRAKGLSVEFGGYTRNPQAPFDPIPVLWYFVAKKNLLSLAVPIKMPSGRVEKVYPGEFFLMCDPRNVDTYHKMGFHGEKLIAPNNFEMKATPAELLAGITKLVNDRAAKSPELQHVKIQFGLDGVLRPKLTLRAVKETITRWFNACPWWALVPPII